MNYFKNYLRTHCKYWWVYILSIFSSLFGIFIVAISFIRIFDAIGIKPIINLVSSSSVAAFIGSLPILPVNKIAAKNGKGRDVLKKTIINHLITLILFYAIMYFCFYWMIIDFRM